MDTSKINQDLKNLVERLVGKLSIDDIENARDLINHAEYGIALELICTQIFEYEVLVSSEILTLIEKIGFAMSMPSDILEGIELE